MENQNTEVSPVASPVVVPTPSNGPFDDFVAKLNAKERAYATKRAAAMAGDPARLALWQRMAVKLFDLAKHSAKVNSKESIQFYVVDGKYRMQMWSLQDTLPGELTIHCRDVIDDLIEKKMVSQPDMKTPNRYLLTIESESLVIERVLPQSAELPAAFRDLLGWGRKCMRIDLPVSASPATLTIIDSILDMSQAVKK